MALLIWAMVCRALFINRSYWPDTEATGQLLTELCEDLAATGEFDVHVLCGLPNHISGKEDRDEMAQSTHNGVTIHRVRHTRFSKKSVFGKLINLITFTVSAWRQAVRVPPPAVVITETDPFFLGLVGRRLQKRSGCRFVAYLQDLYPDIVVACRKLREGTLTRRWRKLLFGAYSKADRVIVLSRDMKDRCVANGIQNSRIAVIPNWADIDGIRPVLQGNQFREHNGLGDRFVVMYSGNMGLPHLLTPILDAAERMRDREDVVFFFVGGGVQAGDLERESRRRNLSNVRFLPYQPKEFLAHSLSAADVQIVSVKPGVISCLMPSKLYGILAAGCSVLAIAPRNSEMAEVIRDNELGEVCDPEMPQNLAADLVKATERLLDRKRLQSIRKRARTLAESEYSRAIQIERFRTLLQDVCRPSVTSGNHETAGVEPALAQNH